MFQGRRNVLILPTSQALMLSAIVLAVAIGAILGDQLAPRQELGDPADRHDGHRHGGHVDPGVGDHALARSPRRFRWHLVRDCRQRAVRHGVHRQSFAAFAVGHLLLGAYQGFASYYRFAAVEATDPGHGSPAISLVVAGGIVAAFLGAPTRALGPGLGGGAALRGLVSGAGRIERRSACCCYAPEHAQARSAQVVCRDRCGPSSRSPRQGWRSSARPSAAP